MSRRCPNCGVNIPRKGALFCDNCGTQLSVMDDNDTESLSGVSSPNNGETTKPVLGNPAITAMVNQLRPSFQPPLRAILPQSLFPKPAIQDFPLWPAKRKMPIVTPR